MTESGPRALSRGKGSFVHGSIYTQAQELIELMEQLHPRPCNEEEALKKAKDGILELVNSCGLLRDSKEQGKHFPSSHRDYVKQHQLALDLKPLVAPSTSGSLDKMKEKLSSAVQANSSLQAKYYERMQNVDKELDELIFSLKDKVRERPVVGNILGDLFSESAYEQCNIEKFDINPESNDSSGPPSKLANSDLDLYNKLTNIRKQVIKYKLDQDTERSSGEIEQFSLPVTLRTLSQDNSLRNRPLFNTGRSDSDLLEEHSFELPGSPRLGLPQTMKLKQLHELFQQDAISLSTKEALLVGIIDSEYPKGTHVCLQDLLSVSGTRLASLSSFKTLSLSDSFEFSSIEKPSDSVSPANSVKPPLHPQSLEELIWPVRPSGDPPHYRFVVVKGTALEPVALEREEAMPPRSVLLLRIQRLKMVK